MRPAAKLSQTGNHVFIPFPAVNIIHLSFPPQFINTMNTGWRQIRTNERILPSCLGSETTSPRWVTKSQSRIIQNRWGGKQAKAAWWPPKQPYSFLGSSDIVHPAADCGLASCFLGTKVNTKHRNEDQWNTLLKESTPSQKITIFLEEYWFLSLTILLILYN